MSLKLVIDEDVNYNIVIFLKNNNFNVISILEKYPGISDVEVLKIANELNAVIITEDSDFGVWLFAHKFKTAGVIFLRYNFQDLDLIKESLLKVITNYKNELIGKFIVLTPKKIRIREI